MGFEGIGASVRRKEDVRFLSGKGNYTDDINRPGQLYAFIKRSDRPHAKINGIDIAAASAAPGVVRGLRRRRHGGRGHRRPALRLADPQQGRLADGRTAAPGDRDRQGAPRRRSGRGGDRGNQAGRRRTPRNCLKSTTRTCRPSRA